MKLLELNPLGAFAVLTGETQVENRSRRSASASGTLSLLSSLIVHLALLLILACWVVVAGGPSNGFSVLFQNDSIAELPSLEITQGVAFDSLPESSSAPLAALDILTPENLVLSIDSVELIEDQKQTNNSLEVALASTSRSSSKAESGSDNQENQNKGSGATFFGAYASGNRFVYVLDSSSSMEGERWNLARQRLIQSLRQLGPEREFTIICFDHETTFLFGNHPSKVKFERATTSMIGKVERWLRYRELGSSTMPAQALQFAISMRPDAIFLLSDGELRDNSLLMLRMLNVNRENNRQVPVHSIHLLSPFGRAALEVIAKENGGTFTLVNEQMDLGRRRR